jgi:hypothetical protein
MAALEKEGHVAEAPYRPPDGIGTERYSFEFTMF